MMHAFVGDIEVATKRNENFREVLFTGEHAQLVVMTLAPGEEIGMEVHEDVDQFFRVEEGEGKIVLESEERALTEDDAALVPAGTRHNVVNTSRSEALKLYTLYAPPKHPDGTVHRTKADAEAAERGERPSAALPGA